MEPILGILEPNILNLIQISLIVLGGFGLWSFSSPASPSRRKKVLAVGGLYNEGNTCFMNSVVQSYASLDTFNEYLQKKTDGDLNVSRELLRLSKNLAVSSEGKTFRTIELVKALAQHGNRHLFSFQQQDAHEFFQHVSDLITREECSSLSIYESAVGDESPLNIVFNGKKVQTSVPKQPKNPFIGLLANRLTCSQCSHSMAWRHEIFDNLSIPVPTNSSHSLLELVQLYTKPEIVSGYICAKCSILATRELLQSQRKKVGEASSKKKKKQDKKLGDVISRLDSAIESEDYDKLPSIVENRLKVECDTMKEMQLAFTSNCLCFHLQRSVFLPNGSVYKNNAPVRFPEILDLNDIILGKRNPPSYLDAMIFTPKSVTDSGELPEEFFQFKFKSKSTNFIYKLKAVILHYGHHESGHFVTLRRAKYKTAAGIKEGWFRVSDSTVENIADIESEVYSHGSNYVYMLFYER